MTEPMHFDEPEAPAEDDATLPGSFPFTIGKDPYIFIARKPKGATMMRLANLADSRDPMVQANLVEKFIDYALMPDSAEYLRSRLYDPEDTWDYPVITPVVNALKEKWSGGPTGGPTASTSRRPRSGGRSTAKPRSTV